MFRCHFCDGRSYYQLDDVRLRALSVDMEAPRGKIVFCASCGWLEVFVEDPSGWAKRTGARLWVPPSSGTFR